MAIEVDATKFALSFEMFEITRNFFIFEFTQWITLRLQSLTIDGCLLYLFDISNKN
jgi:hypothetical protein